MSTRAQSQQGYTVEGQHLAELQECASRILEQQTYPERTTDAAAAENLAQPVSEQQPLEAQDAQNNLEVHGHHQEIVRWLGSRRFSFHVERIEVLGRPDRKFLTE